MLIGVAKFKTGVLILWPYYLLGLQKGFSSRVLIWQIQEDEVLLEGL